MRYTLIILLVLIIVSCSQKSDQSKLNNTANEAKTDSISAESKFDFYSDSVLTHIDAEELCEFSFDFFLPQLNQKLAEKALKLDVQTTGDYESSFEIEINGRKVKLYSNEELSNGKFWDSGPRNFFRIVNEILKEHNLDEQFYLLYGGNDLHTVFMTKDQFELMSKINGNDKNEIPYLP
ncbi:hypothetical protein N9X97_01225 [Schleiferiaceae bacterium]|nr:hypothetical protein [Schleiferiaceae bacterium]